MLSALRAILVLAIPLSLATAQASPHEIGKRLTAKGISNFGEVTPTLYRGAQPTRAGLETLAKMGIQIVVDLRGSASKTENDAAARLGITYISIPNHCPFPKDETWVRFLAVIHDYPGKKIFVHCRLGDDRTGMAIASYRMSEESWTAADAMREMQAFGFTAVHHAMCPGLARYEAGFPRRLKANPAFHRSGAPGDTSK